MLTEQKPLVIDTMWRSWHLSIPGAVGLEKSDAGGDLADTTQDRIRRKMSELTGGDQCKPIVAMGFNSGNVGGYNLALRLRTLAMPRTHREAENRLAKRRAWDFTVGMIRRGFLDSE